VQVCLSAQKHLLQIEDTKLKLNPVNRNLNKHTKHAYHPLRIERVVERVDAFYWDASAVPASESSANAESVNGEATDSETDFLGDDSKLYQCDDLTEDRFIKRLPHNWDTRDEDEFSRDHTPTDQTSYFAAVKRLQDLSQRRHELQLKKNTYRALLSSLEAYRQPIESIQPNLVWKEAPLAPELMKTRALAYRVLGRVEERFEDVEVSATEEDEDVIMVDDDKQKVNEVLAAWS